MGTKFTNCKTCKYWKMTNTPKHEKLKFGDCHMTTELKDIFEYNILGIPIQDTSKSWKHIKAFTEDNEHFYSGLITREDFYCSEYETNNKK